MVGVRHSERLPEPPGGRELGAQHGGAAARGGRVPEARPSHAASGAARDILKQEVWALTAGARVLRGRGGAVPHALSEQRADGEELLEDRGALRCGGDRLRGAQDGAARGGGGRDGRVLGTDCEEAVPDDSGQEAERQSGPRQGAADHVAVRLAACGRKSRG